MPGLLGAMLAEAQSPDGVIYAGIEIDLPSGTWSIANGAVSSTALGHFEDRVLQLSEIPRSLSDRLGGMVSSDFNVRIADDDKRFSNMIGSRERIRDVPARVKILSPNVGAILYWTGRLYDWSQGTELDWTLILRPPDLALKQNFMDKTITAALWPHAADDVRGAIAPIVLGRHDSSGMGTRNGALPTLAVKTDAAPFYRLPSWGWMSSVDHVFEGDVLLTPTTDYTIERLIVGGQRWTVVSLTDDPAGEIRVDGTGYDTVGDLTGTLIDRPTDVLKWIAVNLGLRKNTSGLWFPDASAPVDAASFDAVKVTPEMLYGANGQPYVCSFYSAAALTLESYIRTWCQSYIAQLSWNAEGKLACKLLSSLATGSYVSTPLFRSPHDVDKIDIPESAQDAIRRVVVRYGSQQSGDYIDSLELSDPIVTLESSKSLDLAAGPGFK
jgi:hypothetical protein